MFVQGKGELVTYWLTVADLDPLGLVDGAPLLPAQPDSYAPLPTNEETPPGTVSFGVTAESIAGPLSTPLSAPLSAPLSSVAIEIHSGHRPDSEVPKLDAPGSIRSQSRGGDGDEKD